MRKALLTFTVCLLLVHSSFAQSWTTYKGMHVRTPDPTGDAGLNWQNNFKALADRIGNHIEATDDPGPTDDGVGTGGEDAVMYLSTWRNTNDNGLWFCLDPATNAAQWVELTGGSGASHDAVTLNAAADTVLQLSGQELRLDTQVMNRIFAGPASGADATPIFRALVANDIPDLSSVYQAADADLTTWAGVTSSANGRSLVSAADYAAMKTLLAYGTMADQAASSVAITGGTINGVTLGQFLTSSASPTVNGATRLHLSTDTLYSLMAQGSDGTDRSIIFPLTNSTALTQANVGVLVQPYDADLTALAAISGVNGDLIVRSSNVWTRLAKGTENQVLKMGAALPAWGTDTDTDTLGSIGSVANGDIAIYNSGWTRLAKGDDGQVLKLASGLPSWAADTDTNTTYSAGDGLDLDGTTFKTDLKSGGGLEIDNEELTLTSTHLTGEIGLSWHGTAAGVIDDAVVCPYSGTITSVIITANASGSIELDVWKSASGVPTVADTICNASYPALSAAQQDKAISVAGWSSTAITAGDTIKFEVRSVSTITQATVQLVIAK